MKLIASDRKIHALGRLVIPTEIQNALHLTSGATLDVYLDGDETTALLREHLILDRCLCCGSAQDLRRLPNGEHLCAACIDAAL